MMSKENIVRGNTVLVPQYEPQHQETQKQEELRKSREIKKANRERRIESKAKVMMNICIAFIIGFILIYRFVILYNMRQSLTNINNQVQVLNKENENLTIVLVKANNIENIDKTATDKLHMVKVDKSQMVYTDLTKENFKNTSNKNNGNTEAGFFQRIISKLF